MVCCQIASLNTLLSSLNRIYFFGLFFHLFQVIWPNQSLSPLLTTTTRNPWWIFPWLITSINYLLGSLKRNSVVFREGKVHPEEIFYWVQLQVLFLPVDSKCLRAPTSLFRTKSLRFHVSFLWWMPENTKTKAALEAVCTPTLKSVLGLGNTKLYNCHCVC